MTQSSTLKCTACGTPNAPGFSLCQNCHSPLLLSTYLGSQILFQERYHLIEKLGTGGFGTVYKACDTQRACGLVAIKEFCLTGLPSKSMLEATAAFQHEADLLSQLAHPQLPRLYEQIRTSEQWYLVLDFIEGETNDTILAVSTNRSFRVPARTRLLTAK